MRNHTNNLELQPNEFTKRRHTRSRQHNVECHPPKPGLVLHNSAYIKVRITFGDFSDTKPGNACPPPPPPPPPVCGCVCPPVLVSKKSDIERDVRRVKGCLKNLDKEDLFQELGLFDQTVRNRYSDSSRAEYSEELVRAWILGRDGVSKSR